MANEISVKDAQKTMIAFLQGEQLTSALKASCSKHVTYDRIVNVARQAMSRTPALYQCTPASVATSLCACGQLGVEPNLLGEAYIVPYNNGKTGQKEAQFQIGYRGLMKLARRSGDILTIDANVVHAKDRFVYNLGDSPKIEHEPSLDDDPGEVKWVYAIAELKDGGKQRVVMTKREIEGIRARSKSGQSGPWVTDWNEMAKKTAIKRLCKYLPLTIELSDALEKDVEAETEVIKETEAVVVDDKPKTKADRARAAAAKKEPEVVAVEPEIEEKPSEDYHAFFTDLSTRNPELFAKTLARAAEADQNFMGVKTMDDLERFDEQDMAFLMAQYQLCM